jgi:hypothetical protein
LDHPTALETCILTDLRVQSPDDLAEVIPGGNVGWVSDSSGNPIKTIAEMNLAGKRAGGTHVGYRVRFTSEENWSYFQSGGLIGVTASSMSTAVEVQDFHTSAKVFVADVSNCSG